MVAVWKIVNCRNGISSCEIARAIDCKQQSAWHLLHRVCHILAQETGGILGEGGSVVESDLTYIGGILSNMHHDGREAARERGKWGKTIVHAMKDRGSGKVRARVIFNKGRREAVDGIRENVADGTPLYTDRAQEYKWAGRESTSIAP